MASESVLNNWIKNTFTETELWSVFEINDLLVRVEDSKLALTLFYQAMDERGHFELLSETGIIEDMNPNYIHFDTVRNHLHYLIAGEWIAWKRLSVLGLFCKQDNPILKIASDEKAHYRRLKNRLSHTGDFNKLIFIKYVIYIFSLNISEVFNKLFELLLKSMLVLSFLLLVPVRKFFRCIR